MKQISLIIADFKSISYKLEQDLQNSYQIHNVELLNYATGRNRMLA